MKTWNINLDGSPFSIVYTNGRAKAEKALTTWLTRSNELGYSLPNGELSATLYIATKLDSYGE